MADHRVRIILEAVDRGSSSLRRFFADNEKDIQKFQRTAQSAKKDLDAVFTSSGVRGRDPKGRFTAIKKEADEASESLRNFRRDFKAALAGSSVGSAIGGFRTGASEEREIRKVFEERRNLSKEATRKAKNDEKDFLEDRLKEIRKFHNKELRDFETTLEVEITARHNAEIKKRSDQANFLEDRIRAEREASRKTGEVVVVSEELREQINLLRQEEDQIRANRNAEIAAHRERLRIAEDEDKTIARRESRTRLDAITPSDDASLMRQIRNEMQGLGDDIDRTDNRMRRFGLNAGRALGQFRSGLRIGRNGLTDFEKETLKASSTAERFGARIGNATSSISPFRGRILALISILQIFGTLLVQAGSALVAIASSAILAGAALGGALLAGITQLLPAVGLLIAAFSRLGAVLDATKLADKLELTAADDKKTKLESIKQATQRLSDARYAAVKAAEAVKDAEYDLVQAGIAVKDAITDQRQAVEDLADARKDAARAIVDANFEEKEAALALKDANLAILDAKRRLREEEQKDRLGGQNIDDAKAQIKEAQARLAQARAEGDQAEITTALQQLSVAEQDLQQIQASVDNTKADVEKAKVDVAQAQLNQKEAIVRNRRAQEDAARARKDGVEGSDQVVSARRNLVQATKAIATAQRQQVLATRALRDSVHGLAIAKREETDAETGLTDARKKATAQQENLQNALGDLSPAEKKLFQSIQRIKKIYKENFRPITDIIINAFADAVDTIAPLLQDPKIIKAATTLAEAIGESVGKLARFAVSPEFKKFLEFSLKEGAKNVPKITDGLIDLARVLIRVAHAATPIFDNLIDRFVGFLDKLEQRTRNPKGLNDFFATAGRHLDSWIKFAGAVGRILGLLIKFSAPAGKGILDDLTNKLNEWSDWLSTHGPEARAFFARIRVQVGDLARALTRMTVLLFKAFSSKEAGQLTTFILDTVIPAFAIFLQLISLISGGLIAIFNIPLVGPLAQNFVKFALAGVFLIKTLKTLRPLVVVMGSALRALFTIMRSGVVASILAKALQGLAVAIRVVGIALKFVFITNPWLAVILGLVTAVVLLDRKFHFIRPTLEFLLKIFKKVFEWIKTHWKLLTVILLGPFGLVVIAVVKWHDKILKLIKGIIDWVRDHWKLLLIAALLAPFALTGALIFGIIKFRERLLELFRAIPSLIAKALEKLPGLLLKIFNKIPDLLKQALSGLGGIVKSALSRLPVVGRFFGGGKSDEDKIKDMLKDPALDKQDRAKIQRLKSQGLSGKEIIVKLAKDQGITADQAAGLILKYGFRDGGTVPGGGNQAVPIMAHAGEWVLNKMQQEKLGKRLGESAEQTKMWLFGTHKGFGTPGPSTTGTKPTNKEKTRTFRNFNLVPQQDPDGQIVWFIEMDDGAFGQVSARDARKIIATNGTFIPGYVKRSTHGFSNPLFRVKERNKEIAKHKFALGGVVQSFKQGGVVQSWAGPMLQSFAEGGTVLQQSGFGAPSSTSNTKSIEQNFNVTTQGETDWNYVLRIGALHAEGSYT